MKQLLVLILTITLSAAQRPSYAGSRPIGKPELANRFRDPNEDDAAAAVNVENRLGEGAASSTAKIPVDARGDQVLVDRLNQWPRENRPFWLLNAEHIENQRNQLPTTTTSSTRSSDGRIESRFGAGAGDSIPARGELPTPSFLSNDRRRNRRRI